jgi:hypothetical protein
MRIRLDGQENVRLFLLQVPRELAEPEPRLRSLQLNDFDLWVERVNVVATTKVGDDNLSAYPLSGKFTKQVRNSPLGSTPPEEWEKSRDVFD